MSDQDLQKRTERVRERVEAIMDDNDGGHVRSRQVEAVIQAIAEDEIAVEERFKKLEKRFEGHRHSGQSGDLIG